MVEKLFIRVDEEALDLPEDIQLQMTLNNPWVDKSTSIKASVSFPFTLPATPRNVKKLNHPYRINQKPGSSKIIENVTIGYDNTVLYTGVLLITDATERAIEVSFGVGASNFYSRIADTTLPELFEDTTITFSNTDETAFDDLLIQSVLETADTKEFVCAPFFNWRFYNDDITTSYITEPFQNYLEKDVAGAYSFSSADSIMTPFLYMKYVIETMATLLGFDVKANFLVTDTEFKTLIVYNNYDANGYDLPDNIIPVKELLPAMKIEDFITSTQNLLNVYFDFNLRNNNINVVDIEQLIVSPEYTDWTVGAEAYPVISYEVAKNGYTLEHAIDNNDSIGSTFSQLEEDVEFTILDPVNLVADLPTTDPVFSVRYVYNTKKYYIYSTPNPVTAASWGTFIFDMSKYISGNGDFVIKTNISPFLHRKGGLIFEYDFSGFGTNIYVCHAELNGNSIYNNGNRKEFGMHLMFFRGEKPTEQGGNFVTATCDTGLVFDFDPDLNYALTWEHPTPYGDKGLKTTRYKNYLYWYFNERKVVKYRRYCSLSDLLNVSFAKKYRIGQTNYFIQQLNVTLGMYKIEPAELTLLKV